MGVYIEDALAEDEAANGYVLTCQMKPTSHCVIQVPASSAACKAEVGTFGGRLSTIARDSKTTVSFSLQADQPLAFLPGQYVNLQVPGSKETRSYSFSSPPHRAELSFLIRDVPDGLMSTYMRSKASANDFLTFSGPYGSFYLRPTIRPILQWLKDNPTDQPIKLAYGVNTNDDLVELEKLAEIKTAMPNFDFFTCMVDRNSGHARCGYVTDHLEPSDLRDGDIDVYVCGPPPMVEGVRKWMAGVGVKPKNFLFEKFSSANEAVAA